MPRSRIPTFTRRLESLCEETGVPRFDHTHYDALRDVLTFLWIGSDPAVDMPRFVIGVPLATAGINGMTADDLRRAWQRKFGPPPQAEAA